MKIETKFNVGDVVYLLHKSELKYMTIFDIDIIITNCNDVKIMYNLNKSPIGFSIKNDRSYKFEAYRVEESKLFATKQDLINSL